MDAIRGIEDFLSKTERDFRTTFYLHRGSMDWAESFLDNQHYGVLGPDELGPGSAPYVFVGRKTWPMKIQPKGSQGYFQIGFGAIRRVPELPLDNAGDLARAASSLHVGETRGYLRLDYDSERGYDDTRLYVTDSDFISFTLLLRQHHGLRNTDVPPCLKRPGEDPAWPTFPDKMPLELK